MQQKDKITVKQCGAAEIPQIVDIEEKYIPGGWTETGFSEWLEINETAVIFGAFDGDKLIGFVNASRVGSVYYMETSLFSPPRAYWQ